MTPKEKAIELLDRCEWDLVALQSDGAIHSQQAKQSAEELINKAIDWLNPNYYAENNKYWQQVKEEIEKL